MPGDLDGLTQPALALSAPSVADVDGDGLLTMEEVLALKLDADWGAFVRLQHRNRRRGRIGGGFRPRACLLLRRFPSASCHQLARNVGGGPRSGQ